MALKDVIGQERPIDILKGSLKRGCLSHAYLFFGEEGVGKFFTSINLAKVLNCEGMDGDACDICKSCMEIDRGIHPDVLVIKPEEDQIRIDEIRRAEERLALRALRGRRKILIIDDAHRMNISSANAILKTLEEPPGDSVIILISSAPHLLPPTVLSRCQRLSFGLLSKERVREVLLSKGIKEEAATFIASLSDGRIGKALAKDVNEIFEERDNFFSLFHSIKGPYDAIFTGIEEITKTKDKGKDRTGKILEWAEIWFRDITIYKVARNPKFLINHDKIYEIEALADELSLSHLQECFRTVEETKRALEANANRQLALEVMMIRLAETLQGA